MMHVGRFCLIDVTVGPSVVVEGIGVCTAHVDAAALGPQRMSSGLTTSPKSGRHWCLPSSASAWLWCNWAYWQDLNFRIGPATSIHRPLCARDD